MKDESKRKDESKKTRSKKGKVTYPGRSLLEHRPEEELAELQKRVLHIYSGGALCETDTRGFPTPNDRSPNEIVVDASEGFIPLWDSDVILRWRFQEEALLAFTNAEEIKTYVRQLFGEGVLEWGDAAPIRFSEREDLWDFEIVVREQDNCTAGGCVLASAFFPDAGRHELRVYPRMFQQSRREQVETMAHEVGHVFGLRHFFANVSETAWPSEIFGEHERFSIMNYGADSVMTDNDRDDLKTLYRLARCGTLTHINGTPIRLVRPFSANAVPFVGLELMAAARRA